MYREILQLEPARCKSKREKLPPVTLAEEKIDGHRALLHVGRDLPRSYLTSRRISSKTGFFAENGRNVPHIIQEVHDKVTTLDLDYTVIDGEVTIPGRHFEDVQSVMGALPAKAEDRQQTIGRVVFNAFDVLFFDGQDVRSNALSARKECLKDVVQDLGSDFIVEVKSTLRETCMHTAQYDRVTLKGGEGLVLKDPSKPYGVGWVKWKKQETFDVVITGVTAGTGKYKDLIGAVEFGAYKDGILLPVGKCSGMEDGNVLWVTPDGESATPNTPKALLSPAAGEQPEGSRAWFALNIEALIGSVIEVECNGVTNHGHLRHPRFFRLRNDKLAKDCLAP